MTTPRPPSLFRRVLLAACAAAFAVPALAVASVDGVAEASRLRSSSELVAAVATDALDALADWETQGDPFRYVDFVRARDRAAEISAEELELDADRLAEAWRSTHPTKQVALLGALTQLGVPYRSMASVEGEGFDCSGLTTYAWGRAGITLNRSSGDQVSAAERTEREAAEAGDLVYYPGHVMMYLGIDSAVVHSPDSGNHVEITFVSDRRTNTVVYADPLG